MVPGTGIEPVRPLCRKAADFKSAVSTNFTTRAFDQRSRSLQHPTEAALQVRVEQFTGLFYLPISSPGR
jgi:hypothetical protein